MSEQSKGRTPHRNTIHTRSRARASCPQEVLSRSCAGCSLFPAARFAPRPERAKRKESPPGRAAWFLRAAIFRWTFLGYCPAGLTPRDPAGDTIRATQDQSPPKQDPTATAHTVRESAPAPLILQC